MVHCVQLHIKYGNPKYVRVVLFNSYW